MTLQILFVDDEPNVLDGLRRTLRGFRGEWDMRFAAGGPAALDALDQLAADVVVSDMRMPGMEGDVLLAEVRRRHPRAVRILLTGDCTREALLRVSALAHRVLTKPCAPDELKAAVHQAAALQGVLLGPDLTAAVGRLVSVPSKPELYTRLLAVLDDPDSSLADVGGVCAQDVGVTAKLIQVANSIAFANSGAATSAADAVRRIGAEMTKALVLADGVLTKFDPRAILPFTIDEVWPHSQAVGELTARITRAEAPAADWRAVAPVAGMLHDIGRLVFAVTQPERYVTALRLVQTDGRTVTDAERVVFGVSHAEVGAYLLGLWGLPIAVVEAVAWHHTPTPAACPVDRFSLATALHAAEAILAPDEGGPADADHLTRAGKADRLAGWIELARDLLPAEAAA